MGRLGGNEQAWWRTVKKLVHAPGGDDPFHVEPRLGEGDLLDEALGITMASGPPPRRPARSGVVGRQGDLEPSAVLPQEIGEESCPQQDVDLRIEEFLPLDR